jgi:hypothetical protein
MTTGADWLDSARRLLDAVRPPTDATPEAQAQTGSEPGAAPGADCRWCPVCQTAAIVRGERPDVTAALADVLATTASVLRDLAGEPDRSSAPPAGAGDADGDDPDPLPVQRIDIA